MMKDLIPATIFRRGKSATGKAETQADTGNRLPMAGDWQPETRQSATGFRTLLELFFIPH